MQMQKTKYIAINMFLIFHILAIACWCLPIDSPLVTLLNDQTRAYFSVVRDCFRAGICFRRCRSRPTLTSKRRLFIRMDRKPFGHFLGWSSSLSPSDVFKERYRKFAEDLAREENDGLLPDVARHIARLNSTPSNPAKTVILIQKWSFIVPRPDGSYVPEPWDQHVLLGYGVKPEDLK